MDLEIKEIVDRGNLDQERIIFTAKVDTFLGGFLVFKSKKTGDKTVSSFISNPYWFPDRDIKANDLVVLYTKSGKSNIKENEDGTKTHFFYWLQDKPLWSEEASAVILLSTLEWTLKIVGSDN